MTSIIFKDLARVEYADTFQAMKDFTASRTQETANEIWLLEHPPIFTQGKAGKAEHVLMPSNIPLVASDRGGQVTYHGPGQLIAYLLFDLNRVQISIRCFVHAVEQMLIELLQSFEIAGHRVDGAPGVYVQQQKIASIGMRVTHGCTYHGLSLNVDMDLLPFSYINPCGIAGLQVTQIRNFQADSFLGDELMQEVKKRMTALFALRVF